jgi:hypothetical protein
VKTDDPTGRGRIHRFAEQKVLWPIQDAIDWILRRDRTKPLYGVQKPTLRRRAIWAVLDRWDRVAGMGARGWQRAAMVVALFLAFVATASVILTSSGDNGTDSGAVAVARPAAQTTAAPARVVVKDARASSTDPAQVAKRKALRRRIRERRRASAHRAAHRRAEHRRAARKRAAAHKRARKARARRKARERARHHSSAAAPSAPAAPATPATPSTPAPSAPSGGGSGGSSGGGSSGGGHSNGGGGGSSGGHSGGGSSGGGSTTPSSPPPGQVFDNQG